VLGRSDRGRLEVGAVADLVVLDPASLAVREVWLRGDRAYARSDA
jgi:cytosine/adenosine deaminase-related metal-dependent hydrolase